MACEIVQVHYTGQSHTHIGDGDASMQLCTHSMRRRGFTLGVTGNKWLTSWTAKCTDACQDAALYLQAAVTQRHNRMPPVVT